MNTDLRDVKDERHKRLLHTF